MGFVVLAFATPRAVFTSIYPLLWYTLFDALLLSKFVMTTLQNNRAGLSALISHDRTHAGAAAKTPSRANSVLTPQSFERFPHSVSSSQPVLASNIEEPFPVWRVSTLSLSFINHPDPFYYIRIATWITPHSSPSVGRPYYLDIILLPPKISYCSPIVPSLQLLGTISGCDLYETAVVSLRIGELGR